MRSMYFNLIQLMWLAWLIYWFVAGRNVKATRQVESVASRFSHIVPLIVAFMLLSPRHLPGNFLGQPIVPWNDVFYPVGVVLVATGLFFSCWARYVLGRNWSGVVTVKDDHELIRTGPYRYVRHPIYTGLLLAFIGCTVAIDEWRGVLAVVVAYLSFWRKSLLEEQWMIDTFGDAYRRFRSEVPALIPNPFHRASAAPP